MPLKLGTSAKMYHLSSGTRATWSATTTDGVKVGPAPASLTELSNVQDIEVPIKKTKADVTTRANGTWKATKGTLKELEITVPAIYDNTNALNIALNKAFFTDVTIALALLDGDKATAGTEGVWADWEVTDLEKGEKIEGVQMVSYTLTPGYSAVAPEWVKVAAS